MFTGSQDLQGMEQDVANLIALVDSSNLNQFESNEITDEKSDTAPKGFVNPVMLKVIKADVKVPETSIVYGRGLAQEPMKSTKELQLRVWIAKLLARVTRR